MSLTKRWRIVHILFLLALRPLLCVAYNQTHFELYKNTHFRPCPSKAPRNATVPVADQGAPLLNNASLSAVAFCDRFWNYTVLPTMPQDGAFRLSWVTVVINVISGVISALSMFLLAVAAHDAQNEPAFFMWVQDFDWTFRRLRLSCTSRRPLSVRRPAPAANRPTYQRLWSSATIQHGANLFKTAWHSLKQLDTYKRIWWWSTLLYAVITTVLWWHSFIEIARHPSASYAMLSPTAVLGVLAYFVSLPNDIPEVHYAVIGPLIVVAVLLQQAAAAAALVLFYKSHGIAPQYTVVPAFDLVRFNCDVAAVLRDPTNTTYLVSAGASPGFVVYAFFVIGFFVQASYNFSRNFVARFLGCLYAVQAAYSLISLVFVLPSGLNPIAWDPHCRLVHVMMGSGYGYMDVQVPDAVRSVRTFFTLQTVKTLFSVKW
ncbi:hypothetical protein B0H19DRAFT_1072520 [Mycena capillaripes]|nr:hypothetical protein B0H19DRAFT_1072520 [Mycena capillaripes]